MKKKLIEVALPLEAINREAAREKSIRHGHPSTLHLWWARRPLVACRAVLFASLVDDPSSNPEQFPTEEAQAHERQRLFRIIEELVKWENSTNEDVLTRAHAEIRRSTGDNPPPVLDPFCGGGSIPLEAQRLGLDVQASDLNPVAVLITKSLVEIPPKFADRPPVHPANGERLIEHEWKGAQGLAEDIRYYGQWMRAEAGRRIGHLYPQAKLPKELGGGETTVIAWLWARTVVCPNPSCGHVTPIAKTFMLSSKPGNEANAEPVIDRKRGTVRFVVSRGSKTLKGNVTRTGATCLLCDSVIALDHIRAEALAGRLGQQLLALVAEGERKRVYLDGTDEHVKAALEHSQSVETWRPNTDLPEHALGFRVQKYGMTTHASLFAQRQLVALSTFSGLVKEVAREVSARSGGDEAYSQAVATYLAFAVDKAANYWSALCAWYVSKEIMVSTFGLPTLSMTWDFAEANPFSDSTGNWMLGVEQAASALESLPRHAAHAVVSQLDATASDPGNNNRIVVTDPPYYDNIGYAALSDFFYVWLRHSVGEMYPDLFSTVLTPKMPELIAEPGRFGNDREKAIQHFENGLFKAFQRLYAAADPSFPFCLFYAFKQQETTENGSEAGTTSSGWETMLQALIKAQFVVSGTWPVRTEQTGGLREAGRNALASSIVLVCRPSHADATITSRRDFVTSLKGELPNAVRLLQHGNIAPVDLAQAAIGPGMAVFSRYSKVLESDGSAMRVRTALALINQVLDEVLAEQEGEFDADSRWAVVWFDQHAMDEAAFGEADVLARAKNTSVQGLADAGIVAARAGKVRLVGRDELPANWDPADDRRLTVWEVTQHLIHTLERKGQGEAASLLRRLGGLGESAKDLAYRLYNICERRGWAQDASAYNSLVVAWPELVRDAAEGQLAAEQARLI